MRAGDSTADVRQMGAHVLSALARKWASDHRMWSVLWRRTREEPPLRTNVGCISITALAAQILALCTLVLSERQKPGSPCGRRRGAGSGQQSRRMGPCAGAGPAWCGQDGGAAVWRPGAVRLCGTPAPRLEDGGRLGRPVPGQRTCGCLWASVMRRFAGGAQAGLRCTGVFMKVARGDRAARVPVSYTHLTLPTN